jgi:uncharacterized membrane protein
MAIAITLHILATVIWVGGMFFGYIAVRPAAKMFELPQRAALWTRAFERFFPWVWASAIVLPATGYWMVFYVFEGFANTGLHVDLMQIFGWPMILIFAYLYFVPFPRLRVAVAASDWEGALRELAIVRKLAGINLVLGLLVTVIATGGAYFGAFLQSLGE